MIQHLGNLGNIVHGTNSWCQPLSHFRYPFQFVVERKEKIHFLCNSLHHLEMLSGLLLGILVRRLFPLCTLSYLS